tara:strand:- start:2199 stop:2609 length:411 start_codon:yes stop_codon:yes gene_type:complete
MRRRKVSQDEVGFNITPMIDLTFLLLIFFMVTSKLTKEQLKMNIALPTAMAAVSPDDLSNRDIINLDEAGVFFVGDDSLGDDDLKTYLGERFKANPPLKIYLRADAKTPGKRIREFMKMAADAGAVNVIFGTHPRK